MLVRSPTLTKSESSVTVSGSRPESRSAGGDLGTARAASRRRRPWRSRAMWSGVVPQQPPSEVDQPGCGELAHDRGHGVGRLVVLAERVGQPGVGVARHEGVGHAGQLRGIRPHLVGAEGAVEPDRERAGVPHGVPERLGDLPRERATGGVGDGARDDDRPAPLVLLEQRLEREDRRLGVEGVEDRLDDEQVGAAVDQAAGLLEVGLDELVEGDVALARVVDVGGDRGGAVGRARGRRAPSAAGRASARSWRRRPARASRADSRLSS